VHAAALGIGALRDGAVSCVLGTFNINQIATSHALTSPDWQARCSIPDDLYLLMATSPAGATAMDWVRTVTGLDAEPLGAAVTAALTVPITEADPLFLPFVQGSRLTPAIGGAFVDLGGWHRPLDLLRAGLEGVVFTHRLHLQHLEAADEHLRDRAIRLTGGGSRSVEWSQLMADVTGRRVDITDTHEAGARGAAMLTGMATGVFRDPDDAARRCVTVIRQHHPDPDRHAQMTARFVRWTTAIAALQTITPTIPT
jgi:L-xylulokinase